MTDLDSYADAHATALEPLLLLLPEDAAPEIHRLFEITGLRALLPVVQSWDEASARVGAHLA